MSEQLRRSLEGFLSARLGRTQSVTDLVRLPGGASRESWSFSLPGEGGARFVLRRDPPQTQGQMARSTEAELMRRAAAGGVPVPHVLWQAEGDELGSPAFVMEFVEGETIPRRILREDAYAQARPLLASQCGEVLARLHAVDATGIGLEPSEEQPALEALRRYRDLLDSTGEAQPALELGARWLEQRPPQPARLGLVHGDFRNGNLIVDHHGLRAVLDWELAHIGDPWEDLGWLCSRVWRFGGAGEVGGFGERRDLYGAYERTAGIRVDVDAVRWWETFSSFKWGVICLLQCFAHLSGRIRSHELAAIGRRTCEPEHDLLELILEKR